MEPEELARLTLHYESLSDEDLRDAYDVGPAAHRDQQVWQIVEREFESRGVGKASDNTETLQWDAGSDSFVTVPDSGHDSEPRGLGGWLILVAIGLTIAPLLLALELIQVNIQIFTAGYWSVLTDPSSEAYHPLWAPLFVFESIGNLVLIAVAAAGMVLFFRRSSAFPKLMVSYYLGGLGFIALDLLASNFILAVAAIDDVASLGAVIQSITICVIWIPYMYRSRRVRNTFLQTLTDRTPPSAPEPAYAHPVRNLGGERAALTLGATFTALIVLGTFRPVPTSDFTLRLTLEIDDSAGVISGASEAMDRVMPVIQMRLEEFGVRRPVLERVGRNRIVATLPRVRDAGRLREIITTPGFLEFRITDMQREFEGALDRIDRALVRAGVTVGERSASTVAPQTAIQQLLGAATDTTIQSGDSAADAVDVATERPSETIFSGFLNTGQLPGEVFVVEEDVPQVTRLMEHPEFQRNVPRGIDLLWGREPMLLGGRLYRGLYAVEARPIITGERLLDAQAQLDPITNQAVVNFQLTRAGGRIFGRATGEHVNHYMAIVLDGRVQGQPPVIRSQIRRQGQIELGNTSIGAAQDLALVLRIGALPVPIRIVEARVDSGR